MMDINSHRKHALILNILAMGLLSIFSISRLLGIPIADELVFFDWVGSLLFNGELPGIHPEGYTLYLAVISGIFGFSSEVFRISTFILILSAVPCVYWLSRVVEKVSQKNMLKSGVTGQKFSALALMLFVSSPLITTTASLIDMEALYVVLTPIFFSIFLLSFELKRLEFTHRIVWIPLLGAMMLWVKLGIFPGLAASGGIYLLLRKKYRHLFEYTGSMIVAAILFFITWLATTTILGAPLFAFLGTDASMVQESEIFLGPYIAFKVILYVVSKEIMWISPFLLLLGIVGVLSGGISRARLNSPHPCLLLVLFAIITIIQYAVLVKIPFGFPKYMARVVPILSVSSAYTVSHALPESLSNKDSMLIGLALATVFAATSILPDPYIMPFSFEQGTDLAVTGLMWVTNWGVFAAMTILTIIALYLTKTTTNVFQGYSSKQIFIFLLVIMSLGTTAGFSVIHATADYNTDYYHGMNDTEAINEYWEGRSCTETFDYIVPPESIAGVPPDTRLECIDAYSEQLDTSSGYSHSNSSEHIHDLLYNI